MQNSKTYAHPAHHRHVPFEWMDWQVNDILDFDDFFVYDYDFFTQYIAIIKK